MLVLGYYTDIIGGTAAQSIIDDDGHYAAIDDYERLAELHEPRRSHDYAGLGAGDTTQQTTEYIEMTGLDASQDYVNTVSQ